MSYDNTNRGQIWKNDKKLTESHPDFKGSINVEGVEYWVSGWKRKEGANPKSPALSFSIQAKEERYDDAQIEKKFDQVIRREVGGLDSDIPF